MSASALARTVLMGAIALDVAAGHVQLWHLYVYSVLFGTLGAFFIPGQGTVLPRLMPGDLLEAGTALTNMGLQARPVMAPAAAGLGVAHFGPASSFASGGACVLV